MDSKPWWQSKTVWGVIAMALAFVAKIVFKVDVPDGSEESLTDLGIQAATSVVALLGAVLALFGRAKADTTLTVK